MSHLKVKIKPGMRSTEKIAIFVSMDGLEDYLRVEEGYLAKGNGVHYMPVFILQRSDGAVLIELPQESERGNNRLWVKSDELEESPEVSVA